MTRHTYRMLSVTIADCVTGEPVGGWSFTVDDHLGGYSGPDVGQHFCQAHDNANGEFRLVVGPATRGDSAGWERLGIKIERIRAGEPYYSATFYVSSGMWQ